ncbi:MAG: hypothetical protein HKP27_16620, partial [Myxococcales bacterium]|nr:hypothetical protein [Myxococcales bacterium]
MEAHSEVKQFHPGRERVSRMHDWVGVALLVDDDVAVRRALSRALRARRWTCEEASDAAEAEEILRTADITVVVADQDLP